MAKGVLEIVSDPDPGFYSRLFLVEKASGGWRPVIDLSPLNEFVHQTPFRMETPNSVLLAVRKNDFLVSIDLKDAYFQIPVHPSSRKLLRFVSNDTVYQFRALCFGLSTAPQVFTSFRGSLLLGSLSRSPPATVLGRLAGLVLLRSQDKTSRRPTPHTLPLPQHSDKHGEIRPLPVQARRIPRHGHRHGVSPSVPHRDSNTEIPLLGKKVSVPTEPSGPAVAGVVGTHVIVGEAGTPCEASDALPPVASEVQLVHRERPPTLSSTSVPAGGQGHLVVDGEGMPFGAPLPKNSAYTRTRLGRGGEPTSSISQRQDYGRSGRHRYTSTSWR